MTSSVRASRTAEIDVALAERRIHNHVFETPLRPSRALSELTGANVLLKLENRQITGAFKLRGAANKLLSLTPQQSAPGVVTASNGNHAMAVAAMGRTLGIATEVFVSEHIDPERLRKIRESGALTRQVSGDCLVAETMARDTARTTARVYVSPYNDAQVIAGQGTIAVELLRQTRKVDAVFVAVGGGGLISGIGTHLKAMSPRTQVVGCWPQNSPALHACLQAGRIIEVPELPTLSVSTAGGIEPGSITFDIARRVIDRSVLVSEEEIRAALRYAYREDGELLEGAAGVAVAAFVRVSADYAGKTVVLILCGGNTSPSLAEAIIT